MRFLLVGAVLAMGSVAAADPPAQLQARGEQLAKDGQYLDAIDAFKQADAQEPTPERACLIALAYARRNLYPQAELFLGKCHQRAAGGEVPSWVPAIERTVKDRLEGGTFAPVEIVVTHADTDAKLSVSAFAPDETFEPRRIFLPPGHHTLTATAGADKRERTIDIADRTPRRIVIDFASSGGSAIVEPVTAPSTSHLARNVILAGAGLALAGAIVHLTWYRSELDELDAAENPPDPVRYDAASSSYQASRITAISLYGAGAATVIVGLVLLAVHRDAADVQVTTTHVDGGGIVSLGWSR